MSSSGQILVSSAHASATAVREVERDTREGMPSSLDIVDRFDRDCRSGRVVGSAAGNGVVRRGVDREGVLAVDNGALRIAPLVKPGWGRAGVAYGPFARRSGLTFATYLVNGHNISRTSPLPDTVIDRVRQWMSASGTTPRLARMRRWLTVGRKRFWWRNFQQWLRTGIKLFRIQELDENLAVGWFPSDAPTDPSRQGNGFVVHAVIPEGGDLWARIGRGHVRTAAGLQNIPMYYVVVLRETGAAYYAASLSAVPGLHAAPSLRLLAIDPFNRDETVYAGIHQSVLGETGFRADTRVFHAQVALLPEYDRWYGSAHAADMLTGHGPLHLSNAETGGAWRVCAGHLERTTRGLVAINESSVGIVRAAAPSGLVHALVETAGVEVEGVSLIFRAEDDDNYWSFDVGSHGCRIRVKEGGRWHISPAPRGPRLAPNAVNSVQVFDDGANIRLYLNTDLVYAADLTDTRFSEAVGVGVRVGADGPVWVRAFEAHPRAVTLPHPLIGAEPWSPAAAHVVVADAFDGPPGDLQGRTTPVGGKTWNRDVGTGSIRLTGAGAAKVDASVERPCPGRTVYAVEWADGGFADLQVTITPPGTERGHSERGRAGVIFWQDEGNYIILSAFIGDYPAASIAAFFEVDGFEELYDAVWTNVGARMRLGVPHDFRVVFDGSRFLASIDGEPVLYRAIQDVYPDCADFVIRRVGIVANWEWGNDTGSVFQNFVARARS